MTLDWTLQNAVQNEIETLRSADRVPVGENRASAELLENYHNRATAREFAFESDEPASMAGGENHGPRPLEYFLAGFAFCQQTIYAKNALATGIELTDLRIEVDGDVDPRGVMGVGDVDSGFVGDEIEYTTHIETPATREEIRELVELAESRCPAHAALRKPMSFDREIIVNGDPLE